MFRGSSEGAGNFDGSTSGSDGATWGADDGTGVGAVFGFEEADPRDVGPEITRRLLLRRRG